MWRRGRARVWQQTISLNWILIQLNENTIEPRRAFEHKVQYWCGQCECGCVGVCVSFLDGRRAKSCLSIGPSCTIYPTEKDTIEHCNMLLMFCTFCKQMHKRCAFQFSSQYTHSIVRLHPLQLKHNHAFSSSALHLLRLCLAACAHVNCVPASRCNGNILNWHLIKQKQCNRVQGQGERGREKEAAKNGEISRETTQ